MFEKRSTDSPATPASEARARCGALGEHFARDVRLLRELSSFVEWSDKNFAHVILTCGLYRVPPEKTPDRIVLGGLRERLDELQRRTSATGVEWGQAGFAEHHSRKISFKAEPDRGGPESVAIDVGRPPGGVALGLAIPAIIVHSHPDVSRHGLHLSPPDYHALLSNPSIVAQCVVFRGRVLIAVRTAVTSYASDPERGFAGLTRIWEETAREARSDGELYRRATERSVIEHGLSLFVTQSGEPNIARKVVLRG